MAAQPESVVAALWPAGGGSKNQLFAVLDGARNEGIYAAVATSGCEYECLYRGELEPDLAEVAPYLVRLQQDHPFTYWLAGKGWGDSWGIYLQSAASLKEVRQHLRKFLMVYDPDAKPLYFRYYDPRVLRVYLPTCDAEELQKVFGPVQSYLLENEDGTQVLRFSADAQSLQTQTTALQAEESGRR
jgi:hypothetical protein